MTLTVNSSSAGVPAACQRAELLLDSIPEGVGPVLPHDPAAVLLIEGSPRAGLDVDENVLGMTVAFHRQVLCVGSCELHDEKRDVQSFSASVPMMASRSLPSLRSRTPSAGGVCGRASMKLT